MTTTRTKNNNNMNNFLQYITANKKIIYPIVIILIIVIILLLVWPLINQGKLIINSAQYPITISYCQTYLSKEIITTNNEDGLGCQSSDLKQLNISESIFEKNLTPGTYYIVVSKPNYQTKNYDFTVNFNQTTSLDIDLQPIGITISDQLIYDFKYDKTNNTIYYLYEEIANDENQNLITQFVIDKNIGGKTTNLFKTAQFTQIEKTYWSPDYEKLIIVATESEKESQKYLINIPDNTTVKTSLPKQDIIWSSNSDSIYYLYQDQKEDPSQTPPSDIPIGAGYRAETIYGPNHNTITKANPDGSNWEVMYKLDNDLYDTKLYKSDNDKYFGITTSNLEGFIYNSTDNSLSKLDDDILFNKISFSPDNQIILAETVNNNYRPVLQFANINDLSFNTLNIITFIDKTTWIDNNQLVVAIGDYIPSTTLTDILNTTDKIKYITFENNNFTISEWNNASQVIDGAHKLKGDNNSLFLIDKDNYLYFIPYAPTQE